MQRTITLALFSLTLLAMAEASDAVKVGGYVTNKACDARAMKADPDACMRKCRQNGEVQFVDDKELRVWDVTNAAKLATLEGKHVSVTAKFDVQKKTMEVVSVTPDSKPVVGDSAT